MCMLQTFGAGDPISGTATLLEAARGIGKIYSQGNFELVFQLKKNSRFNQCIIRVCVIYNIEYIFQAGDLVAQLFCARGTLKNTGLSDPLNSLKSTLKL